MSGTVVNSWGARAVVLLAILVKSSMSLGQEPSPETIADTVADTVPTP
jgi:hypothetical protein